MVSWLLNLVLDVTLNVRSASKRRSNVVPS
jgi:hypothetical protein